MHQLVGVEGLRRVRDGDFADAHVTAGLATATVDQQRQAVVVARL